MIWNKPNLRKFADEYVALVLLNCFIVMTLVLLLNLNFSFLLMTFLSSHVSFIAYLGTHYVPYWNTLRRDRKLEKILSQLDTTKEKLEDENLESFRLLFSDGGKEQ